MDGWVVIGTKLDSKQLEKDLKDAQKRLQQYEKEAEKLTKAKAKAEIDLKPYEEQKRLIQELSDESLQYAQSQQEVKNVLDTEKIQLEELNQKYSKQTSNLEDINKKIKENAISQQLVSNEIEETNKKLNKTKGITSIKDIIDDIGKSTTKTIKKVGQWALAIFGIRSAYMFVRNAIGTLSQYNEQIASDVEYIRFALASMLQPVIEKMIQLAYKLLSYINYIAKAWFGVDLFANASAKSMEKGSKSAEKMKKSLAGFDEMNVLNDNGTVGAMGAMPSFDLSTPENVEPPAWLVWIAENKDVVLGALAGISAGLLAISFGASLIMGLGIGILIAGVIMLIQDIIDMINDPSWQNFFNILGDIAFIIGGIMLVMGNWWGLLFVIVGAVVKLVADNWETIKGILIQVGDWIYNNVVMPTWGFIQILFNSILAIINGAISIINGIFTTLIGILTAPFQVAYDTAVIIFNGIVSTIRYVFDIIAGIFTGDWKRVMDGFKGIFKTTFDSLWGIAKAPLNLVIGGINALIKGLNKIKIDVPEGIPGIGGKKWGFNIPTIPKLAVGGIVNMPGKGVPIGGAIAGEVRKEGVIPLTDAQAMEELGATIGRYITVNANITNTMNGRVISRELHKINANNDFATNS